MFPTGKTERGWVARKALLFLIPLCTFPWGLCNATGAANALRSLQDLGVAIKHAADRIDSGAPTQATSLAEYGERLRRFEAMNRGDDHFARKFRAVSLLLEKASHGPGPLQPLSARSSTRRADDETTTRNHGDTCRTALGISENLPVRITLGGQGKGRDGAWFRFLPRHAGNYSFATDSAGGDPALEAFAGCKTAPAAANDDSLGLDARLQIAAGERQALLVHLTNSSQAGSVILSVVETSGTIAGTITDAATAQPLAGANVSFYNTALYSEFSTTTGQDGTYSVPVAADTYYGLVQANGYVAQLYPKAHCGPNTWYFGITQCPLAQGTTVPVASGATVTGIDFAVDVAHQISGVVLDDVNQPLAAHVKLYDGSGTWINAGQTDGSGAYAFSGLPAGSYRVSASADGYGTQLFDHATCAGPLKNQCELATATEVSLSNADVSDVSFNLPQLAAIQGSITWPQIYLNGRVCALDTTGNPVACGNVYIGNYYRIGPLAPGSYFVYATSDGFFSQLFDHADCGPDCSADIGAATAVTITQPDQQVTINFALDGLPQVHGHVQDALTAQPLAGVLITASVTPPDLLPARSAESDDDGNFTLYGTPAGRYYVLARSGNHLDVIYPQVPCEQPGETPYTHAPCDVTGAILLTIDPQQVPPNLNFSLMPSSSLSGHAGVRAGTGADLPADVEVDAFDGSNAMVASANTDALGNYVIGDLPPGTYFAASNLYAANYVPQIWQQIDCLATCAATTGTPVQVEQNSTTSGVDFLLTRRDAVVGRVTDTDDNPLGGVLIDLFDAASGTYFSTATTDANGFYAATGNTGQAFFVATDAGAGYIDQVYSGIACPNGPAHSGLCPLFDATAVMLAGSSSQPHIVNFALKSTDPIFGNGFEVQ